MSHGHYYRDDYYRGGPPPPQPRGGGYGYEGGHHHGGYDNRGRYHEERVQDAHAHGHTRYEGYDQGHHHEQHHHGNNDHYHHGNNDRGFRDHRRDGLPERREYHHHSNPYYRNDGYALPPRSHPPRDRYYDDAVASVRHDRHDRADHARGRGHGGRPYNGNHDRSRVVSGGHPRYEQRPQPQVSYPKRRKLEAPPREGPCTQEVHACDIITPSCATESRDDRAIKCNMGFIPYKAGSSDSNALKKLNSELMAEWKDRQPKEKGEGGEVAIRAQISLADIHGIRLKNKSGPKSLSGRHYPILVLNIASAGSGPCLFIYDDKEDKSEINKKVRINLEKQSVLVANLDDPETLQAFGVPAPAGVKDLDNCQLYLGSFHQLGKYGLGGKPGLYGWLLRGKRDWPDEHGSVVQMVHKTIQKNRINVLFDVAKLIERVTENKEDLVQKLAGGSKILSHLVGQPQQMQMEPQMHTDRAAQLAQPMEGIGLAFLLDEDDLTKSVATKYREELTAQGHIVLDKSMGLTSGEGELSFPLTVTILPEDENTDPHTVVTFIEWVRGRIYKKIESDMSKAAEDQHQKPMNAKFTCEDPFHKIVQMGRKEHNMHLPEPKPAAQPENLQAQENVASTSAPGGPPSEWMPEVDEEVSDLIRSKVREVLGLLRSLGPHAAIEKNVEFMQIMEQEWNLAMSQPDYAPPQPTLPMVHERLAPPAAAAAPHLHPSGAFGNETYRICLNNKLQVLDGSGHIVGDLEPILMDMFPHVSRASARGLIGSTYNLVHLSPNTSKFD